MVERFVLEIGEAGFFGRMGNLEDELALAFGLDVEIVVALARQRTRAAGQPVVPAQDGQRIGDRNVGRVFGERFAKSVSHSCVHELTSGSMGSSPHQSAMNSAMVCVTLRTELRSTASS